MKVLSRQSVIHVDRPRSSTGRTNGDVNEGGQTSEQVRVHGAAKFVASTRAAAVEFSELRAQEIVRAQNDISSGLLFSDSEIESAVDVILAGM